MATPARKTAHPRDLIEEITEEVSTEEEPIDYKDEPTDRHVVCIILTPDLKNVAWVFNLDYPLGKGAGWGIVGGRSEPNESVTETATREIREETGIKRFEILDVVRQGWIYPENKERYMRTILICVAGDRGNPKTKAVTEKGIPQTREFRWFPLDKLPDRSSVGEERIYYRHLNTLFEIINSERIREIELEHWAKIRELKDAWDEWDLEHWAKRD